MQSQLKTVQPQSKTLRKKGKIQLEPERLLFIASANSNFQLQMQGPARGYPLWTCSLQFSKRNLIKNNFFKQGIFFDVVKVCFFLLLKSMQSQLKTVH